MQQKIELMQQAQNTLKQNEKANEEEREKFEKDFYAITAQAVRLINDNTSNTSSLSSSSASDISSRIKLPPIELLHFDGSYDGTVTAVSFDQRHPLLMPSNHKLTDMLIRQQHIKLLHAGPQAVLASLRLSFWPLSGRNAVRRVIRQCVTCFRCKPTSINPLMGNLPLHRINQQRPFLVVGIDNAGPITLKESHRRGKPHTYSSYVAVFVCMATKAVHVELVN